MAWGQYLDLVALGDVVDWGYAIVPFAAWLLAGASKFVINSIKAGRLAFEHIGYGGLPSNHSAIVGGIAALIAIREGFNHPAFGIAIALALIVILDAHGLRRHIGKHAKAINRLRQPEQGAALRERMGHTYPEIGAGIIVGIIAALLVDWFFATLV